MADEGFDGSECPLCLPGSYSDEQGLAECKLCDEGYFSKEFGGTQCKQTFLVNFLFDNIYKKFNIFLT